MRLEPDTVKPYFGILTYHTIQKQFHEPSFRTALQNEFNNRRQHTYDFISEPLPYQPIDNLYVYVVSHKYPPSWLANNHRDNTNMDKENDLLLIYKYNTLLFINCSCENLTTMVHKCLMNDFRKLSYREYAKILSAQYAIQFKSLGIKNIFGAGGMAPETKAYFGQDMERSLSNVDLGYGLNFFLGNRALSDGDDRESIGCSPKKNKLWAGRTDGLDDFKMRCEEIYSALQTGDGDFGVEMLVQPTDPHNAVAPVGFYLDYYVQDKGYVLLGTEEIPLTPNWTLDMNNGGSVIRIYFDDDQDRVVDISFERNDDGIGWVFNTINDSAVLIKFSSEDLFSEDREEIDDLNTRSRNLLMYLNQNENFTILFEGGIAFRDHEYYLDNRLTEVFNNSYEKMIDWSNINIERESRRKSDDDNPSPFIEDAIKKHVYSLDPIVAINDDGSNEAADFIVVTSKKFILVHAKASGGSTPSLRVGDLQVVVSQAIKNLRFFNPLSFTERHELRWHAKQFYTIISQEEMSDRLKEAAFSRMVERECWIVQPGISRSMLEADVDNKIHSLLNHLDSICKMRNIRFRLICSP